MRQIYNELIEKIDKESIYLNEPMKNHTTFKIGGPADIFVKAKNVEDVIHTLLTAKEHSIPVTVIGNGSNVLVKDKGIRGITIKIDFNNVDILDNNTLEVGAGVLLPKISRIAYEHELTGLEFATGIPGTVGGAIYMNAGAYGSEMSNIILNTTYIDKNLEIKTINNFEQDFSYRKSIFQENEGIILSAKLKLEKGINKNILEKMESNKANRKQKQPINYPSAGSVFKRYNDVIPAKLIEEANLKGYSMGGAQISTLHSGFIINTGDATAEDVLNLVKYIKKIIKERYNEDIKLEIKVIGE